MQAKMTEEEKAREAALRLLDYQDRTRAELKSRLMKKGYSEELSQSVTDDLSEANLINDERYAELYTESLINSGKGSILIKNKLREKGISDSIINAAFENLSVDETQRFSCLNKALSFMGIAEICHIDEEGYLIRTDDESNPLNVFSSRVSEGETDKNKIFKEREKAKNSLARRLLSRGFASSDVFDAIRKLDEL